MPDKSDQKVIPFADNPNRIPPSFLYDPEAELPPERVYYEGFLSEGELAVWIGREKHRKTTVMLQFAICAALGLRFLTFNAPPFPLRVVILDYESKTRSLRRRYDAICAALRLSAEQLRVLRTNLRILELRRYISSGNALPKFPGKAPNEAEEKFWRAIAQEYPADLYLFDPMRCLHREDENDSAIEALLSKIRQVFGKAAVVIAHHMTKRGGGKDIVYLKDDMRAWSDGARGSGAIKAHADAIVCQEQVRDSDEGELIYWGAFLKDAGDIEPIPLIESDVESFYWEVSPEIPSQLKPSLTVLQQAGGQFNNKAAAAKAMEAAGRSRSSSYRDVEALIRRGLIVVANGVLQLKYPKPTSTTPILKAA